MASALTDKVIFQEINLLDQLASLLCFGRLYDLASGITRQAPFILAVFIC